MQISNPNGWPNGPPLLLGPMASCQGCPSGPIRPGSKLSWTQTLWANWPGSKLSWTQSRQSRGTASTPVDGPIRPGSKRSWTQKKRSRSRVPLGRPSALRGQVSCPVPSGQPWALWAQTDLSEPQGSHRTCSKFVSGTSCEMAGPRPFRPRTHMEELPFE